MTDEELRSAIWIGVRGALTSVQPQMEKAFASLSYADSVIHLDEASRRLANSAMESIRLHRELKPEFGNVTIVIPKHVERESDLFKQLMQDAVRCGYDLIYFGQEPTGGYVQITQGNFDALQRQRPRQSQADAARGSGPDEAA